MNTNLILTFINMLCLHLGKGFSENEIEEWSAFDLIAIVQCNYEFGIENISSLSSKYKQFLQEEQIAIQQYSDFRFLVAEKKSGKAINRFPDMAVLVFQNDHFAQLAKLMDIGGTFLNCRLGFSLVNSIKTKLRNRLHLEYFENGDACLESPSRWLINRS